MAHTDSIADAIIKGIHNEAAQVATLLTTPLMVALLMVRYKIDQSLPQNSASFYGSLFSLLLQRHDKTKGGYIRPRKSGVSDTVLEDFFNALCFVTRKANEDSFTRTDLIGFAKEAMKIIGSKGDVDKILADIIEITCMVVNDGDEFRFIHKSVQEYHAALFIREQPDEMAIAFYRTMEAKWMLWQQDLHFLSEIDRYRYLKFFYIKDAQSVLNLGNGVLRDSVTHDLIMKVCGSDQLEFNSTPENHSVRCFSHASSSKNWSMSKLLGESEYGSEFFRIIPNKEFLDSALLKKTEEGDSIGVSELLKVNGIKQEVEKACIRFCQLLQRELKDAEKYVDHIESTKTVFQF
jgi:hypothetical protein